MEIIIDIQYRCSESMNIHYSNVDTEWIIVFYWTIWLKKVDNLDMRNPIYSGLQQISMH